MTFYFAVLIGLVIFLVGIFAGLIIAVFLDEAEKDKFRYEFSKLHARQSFCTEI